MVSTLGMTKKENGYSTLLRRGNINKGAPITELAQGGGSPNSHCMNSPSFNSLDLVQVRLQHTSDIRVELRSQERSREHIVVAMVPELGKQVLDVDRSSVGREASLDTQGVMVFLQDMELVIGKEV